MPGLPFMVAAALVAVAIAVLEALYRLEASSGDDDDEEDDEGTAAEGRGETATTVKIADAATLMAPPVAEVDYRPLPKA